MKMILNRKHLAIVLFLVLTLLFAMPVKAAPITKALGTITLTGGSQAGNFPQEWDLTACDLTLSFTYDANGLVDDSGAHAWAELGVRAVGYGNFNPTWMAEGAGVWLATDYDWSANTFDPDPPGAANLDLDDKLILQKGGGWGEGSYNLPSTPLNPGGNHRVWWDRDGVDPWQNPETANTGGIYPIVITLHATSATTGEAYMNIRGLDQGFEVDGNWNTIELTPAGMTFTGNMKDMQVFYGIFGYNATHTVSFEAISVTGCPATSATVKGSVLAQLTALRADVTDKQDGKKLDEAIKHLTKSLDDKLWVDETQLQAKHGEKVFNEEKDAVVKLLELLKDKKSTIPDAKLQGFIDRLVGADKALAQAAVDAAPSGKEKDKAMEELLKGDARALDGKFVDAIEHYRNAWKHAIEAV
jgi:hypothetical protein